MEEKRTPCLYIPISSMALFYFVVTPIICRQTIVFNDLYAFLLSAVKRQNEARLADIQNCETEQGSLSIRVDMEVRCNSHSAVVFPL